MVQYLDSYNRETLPWLVVAMDDADQSCQPSRLANHVFRILAGGVVPTNQIQTLQRTRTFYGHRLHIGFSQINALTLWQACTLVPRATFLATPHGPKIDLHCLGHTLFTFSYSFIFRIIFSFYLFPPFNCSVLFLNAPHEGATNPILEPCRGMLQQAFTT